MTDTATVLDDAARLRNELADALLAKGSITSEHVDDAFRAVPRHLFAPPGTSLKDASADTAIRTDYVRDNGPRLLASFDRDHGLGVGSVAREN